MRNLTIKFWKWYEKHKTLNLGIAAFLFTLQIVHLIWLFGDVVYFRLAGTKIFDLQSNNNSEAKHFFSLAILLVDYLEIPAIVTTSLFYISELRQKFSYKNLWLLFFINSQWLHLFWITDEFVVYAFTGSGTLTVLPFWLAWIAILIDYLELPVIYDTLKKFTSSLKKEGLPQALEKIKES